MHPDTALQGLLMAARGHADLPMQIHGAPDAGIGGALPVPAPAVSAQAKTPGGSDRQVAEQAASHLIAATAQVKDPQLKAAFAKALSALHSYIAGVDKEHQQALAGKLSPRLMAEAHGKAA